MTHRQHGRSLRPTTLNELEGHVPHTFIEGAFAASEAFRQANIRHVLVGGLAVGVNGYPRSTKDIDFLVDENAFEFHGPLVTHRPGLPISYAGIGIDWISLEPQERKALDRFLVIPDINEVPIIPVEPLVAMKLVAGRHKDQADIVELVKSGTDVESCIDFIECNFASVLPLFNRLVKAAHSEG
jgi:hypothetical protein